MTRRQIVRRFVYIILIENFVKQRDRMVALGTPASRRVTRPDSAKSTKQTPGPLELLENIKFT